MQNQPKRIIQVWTATIIVLTLTSCATPPRGSIAARGARDDGELLRQRAEDLWNARSEEDWETVFLFEDPRERQNVEPAEFARWCDSNEPIRIHSYSFGEIRSEIDWGWVEVDSRKSTRLVPNPPQRDIHNWEKWRRVQGEWYPVPRAELDAYPTSPALRDANAESRLRAGFDDARMMKLDRDWDRLYELSDPQDRADVSKEEFVDAMELLEYLSIDVLWVEVLGDMGTVRVTDRVKWTDPSMTKAAPFAADHNEKWVRRGERWYLDLKLR